MAAVWAGLVAVPPANAAEAYLVAAGDIASCVGMGDTATAALVGASLGTVATLGDNVYNTGTAAQFRNCYGPTWGRFKDRTRPSVGNHDYGMRDASFQVSVKRRSGQLTGRTNSRPAATTATTPSSSTALTSA